MKQQFASGFQKMNRTKDDEKMNCFKNTHNDNQSDNDSVD